MIHVYRRVKAPSSVPQAREVLHAYFVFGTTAEFIKMRPVLDAMSERSLKSELWCTGQQYTELQHLGILDNASILLTNGYRLRSIKTKIEALIWFIHTFLKLLLHLRKVSSSRQHSILLVHGDTLSTLVGAICGRICHFRVGHIEAGLRSGNWRVPFPEELTRRIIGRIANIHFAPNDWAASNLPQGSTVLTTNGNTAIDAIAQRIDLEESHFDENYALIILHRTELLSKKELLLQTIQSIHGLSRTIKVVWVMDNYSQSRFMMLFGDRLSNDTNRITILDKLPHDEFVKLLVGSSFVVTDSGGIQEECAYIGKSCYVYRDTTERKEGLDKSVKLLGLNPSRIEELGSITHESHYVHPLTSSPSQQIAEYLANYGQQN